MKDLHGGLDVRQLIDEVHGQALEERSVIVRGVIMVKRSHQGMIMAVGRSAIGVYQLQDGLFVQPGFQTVFQ
jgi:hypothetical protein